MLNWYAVQTKLRREQTAEENLERQGFAAYLPRIRGRRRKRNKSVDAVEPVPGEIVIQAAIGS
jgi:transcriptional antiterminator RfaH